MVLGFTAKSTTVMSQFFNSWEKICDDGFGYYIRTSGGYEYLLKAPHNCVFKTRQGVRTFMLHCRQKTSGSKDENGGEENHPYLSEDQRFLLVHNGHMTNYEETKKKLIAKGHKFESSVDSEFLLHSFEEVIGKRGITEKVVKEWIQWLNKRQVSGTVNVIMLDRTTDEWFAYSDGSIEVMKPIASNDLFVGTNSIPFKDIPVFTFDLKTGKAIFGKRSIIISIEDVGKIGTHYAGYGYYENGQWAKENDMVWRRIGTGGVRVINGTTYYGMGGAGDY